ncbi:hypothetical protein [Nakamurella panacisegetis]|uniref:hypothetical protein n=1 Tax=Nakamurella panacisegetis TaxID=1090615 RepID=UPI0012FE677E|nr:hypothetical protein [Nakamurella panacisegetis]
MPAFVAADSRDDYLAGWVAGQAAAQLDGPLPDELARDVVSILEISISPTTGQAALQHQSTSVTVVRAG